jgi:capsular exopolysaccharide synthesis family protein
MRVMTRRRKWIVASVIAGAILAMIVTMVMKPTYEATTTIELNKGGAGSMDVGLGDVLSQGLGGGTEALLTDLQTETTILEGDTLALSVIQKLNMASQPEYAAHGRTIKNEASEQGLPLEQSPRTRTRLLRIFKKHVKVAPVHGTRLIRVSFESHDPKEAAMVANAMIDSYKAQYLKSHYDATSEASDWLTKQLSDLKANVEDSEKKLADFEKETGIISLNMMGPTGGASDGNNGGVHSVVIEKLDALNNELTTAEANRIEKEAIYRLAQSNNGDALLALASNPQGLPGNSMVVSQGGLTALQQLRQQQNTLKMNLAQASATYGANNRHLKDIQTQISEANEQIQQEMQNITKLAHADLQLAQRTEGQLRQQFNEQQAAASKLNEKTVQFAVLSQEAYSRKSLYEDLYTKLQEANVSAGIKATNITIVDPARSQSIPIRPKRVPNLEVGLVLGLLAGLILAFTVDRLDRTVINPLEVEEITGMPVIGIIPTFGDTAKAYGFQAYGTRRVHREKTRRRSVDDNSSASQPIWMLDHPESVAAEAFRSLRTAILLARAGGGLKIILVTSCIPGEGKSTVTGNLAISFAQHGKKVIIVEADMRRPTMRHVMDVSNEAGLSNVLAGTLTLDEAILRGVHVPTLDILPAGPRPPLPSEILGSTAFDDMLAELKSRYDLVLLDSPPALLLTDAVSIASKTDATVWVSRAGVVTRPQLARAAQLIERNGMPVIGFIMNHMDKTLDPYGYGYGYGYGYDYKSYGSYYGEKDSNDA